ncbi:unnamed protein product [Blepharisma stoltei]|uniref:4a-hydroxytetrahydrobiopterin dehydratase n=1 Tax=Blepharisma stoltei TaxID=1481888 RepID=A0AAU9IU63_9CILI|nr:unnamed protein product [Blepharisma stoltei]
MIRKFTSQIKVSSISDIKNTLPSWNIAHDASELSKTYRFQSYTDAWDFFHLVSKVAAQNKCPPSWSFSNLNVNVKFPPEEHQDLTLGQVRLAMFMDKAQEHIQSDRNFN